MKLKLFLIMNFLLVSTAYSYTWHVKNYTDQDVQVQLHVSFGKKTDEKIIKKNEKEKFHLGGLSAGLCLTAVHVNGKSVKLPDATLREFKKGGLICGNVNFELRKENREYVLNRIK